MSKKKKFDLTHLVHAGFLKDGETVYFLSDPSKTATVSKQPNGEYKFTVGEEILTVHATAQRYLGQEPPDHACRWFRNAAGKTLYELWQSEFYEEAEAA